MAARNPKPKPKKKTSKARTLQKSPTPGVQVVPGEDSFRLGAGRHTDDLGELLGEAAVQSMTSGDQAAEEFRDEELPEENGGPFVETSAETEIAHDGSEPIDSEPAPLPQVNRQG